MPSLLGFGPLLAAFLLLFCPFSCAFNTVIRPNSELCIEESAQKGEKLYGSFAVYSGGQQDIDLTIYSPDLKVLFFLPKAKEDTFQTYAQSSGTYKICFSNQMSTLTAKELSFHVYIGAEANLKTAAKAENVSPLASQISFLSQSLNQAKDVQDYLRTREIRHAETTNSSNSRILLWFLFKFLVLCGVSATQIWFLLRLFEKKRGY